MVFCSSSMASPLRARFSSVASTSVVGLPSFSVIPSVVEPTESDDEHVISIDRKPLPSGLVFQVRGILPGQHA